MRKAKDNADINLRCQDLLDRIQSECFNESVADIPRCT